MVKGLTRKVIVIKSPDPKIFEQAIFIVKDDYLMTRGIDQKELMRQANEAASEYIKDAYKSKRKGLMKITALAVLAISVVGIIAAISFTML